MPGPPVAAASRSASEVTSGTGAFPRPVYFDNLATTALDPRALDAMLPFLRDNFGNASSRTHDFGLNAAAAVEQARTRVAQLIGASEREIVFTGGATESNNLAIKGTCDAWAGRAVHLITCVTEHHAVLDVVDRIEADHEHVQVTRLPVHTDGTVDLAALDAALAVDCQHRLLSIMAANNETGVLQPLDEISRCVSAHGEDRAIVWHCDAAQAVGKVPLDLRQLPIDLLSMSAHKLHGPKGQGALFVRRRRPPLKLRPQIEGGGQERGLRSGTLNVPGIVGFGAAAELAMEQGGADAQRMGGLRDWLQTRLLQAPGVDAVVNGHLERRLPNALNISFGGIHGADLLPGLRDVALSSGSACSSGSTSPSHVLTAMGRNATLAAASLRFGLGRDTTQAEVEYVARRVLEQVGSCGKLDRP